MSNKIQVAQLSFQYPGTSEILRFPDIQLQVEEHLLILGKSGVGKTTLLHLMAGLLTPKDGSISIGETSLGNLSNTAMDKFRGEHIGLVFQNNHAIRSLTVMENLKARLFFSNKKKGKQDLLGVLEQLDIASCKDKKPNELSEGQLQRLGIALAVVHAPQLILADEPTASLDDENSDKVMQLLRAQARKNKANLVVITHDQRLKTGFQNTRTL